MSKCPSKVFKSNPNQEKSDWDLLVDKVGVNQAYMHYMLNDNEIPSIDTINALVKEDNDLALDEARTVKLNRLESILKGKSKPIAVSEIAWFQERFPNIPIEDIKGLIDDKSLGRFISTGRVLLSSEATENTLRHEAFHVISQLYLSSKEIQSIYKETRDRLNNQELTDLEVEEILAEDFANYADTGNILNNRPLSQGFFEKLFNLLKKLLGLSQTDIRSIYNKLETGSFTGKRVYNNRQFKSLDRAFEGKSEAFTKDVLDGMDSIFYDILFENGFTPQKLFQVSALKDKIFDNIYNEFVDIHDNLKKINEVEPDENTAKLLEDYKFILRNWETVVAKYTERVSALGVNLVSSKDEKTLTVDPTVEQEEDPNIVNDQSVDTEENRDSRSGSADYKAANLTSTKDLMFKQIKLLIRSLPSVTSKGVDENGDLILENVKNDLYLDKLVDFNSTYNYILKNLSGVSDYGDMIAKLEILKHTKPELQVLINRIGKPSDTISSEQMDFQNQFRQDFDKNFAVSFKTIIKADGVIYVVDATKENMSGKIKEVWRNKLKGDLKAVHLNSEGRLIAREDINSTVDNVKYLEQLGITFSKETIPAMQNNEAFNTAVQGIKKYIKDNEFDITDLYSEKSDSKGDMNVLLDLEAEYTTDVNELSFMSTEGKTVYSISQNHMLSIVKNIINNTKGANGVSDRDALFAKLPHLDTVYTKNSIWLKNMFDLEGNRRAGIKINYDLYDGLATGEGVSDTQKKATTKLSPGDKLVQELNNTLLRGTTAVIRTADKATEGALSLSKYSDGKLPISIESVKNGVDVPKLKAIFKGYFKDELQRMFELEILGVGKNIDIYRDNAAKWGIFEGFPDSLGFKALTKETLEYLKSDVGSQLSKAEKQEKIDTIFLEMSPIIEEATVKFFTEYSKEVKAEYAKYGITAESGLGIDKTLLAKYTPNGKWIDNVIENFKDYEDTSKAKSEKDITYRVTLPNGKLISGKKKVFISLLEDYRKTQEGPAFDQLIRALAVNDFINSVEQVKLFFGDMAFYKDFFKRTSAAVGTGKTARVDAIQDSWLNNNYTRLDGKPADGKINVLVYRDSNQKSNYFKEYLKSLMDTGMAEIKAKSVLKAYNDMDEADAQGYITLDEYREFFHRTGDWLPEHQAQYEYEQNIYLKNTGKEYNKELVEKGSPGFFFMPIKAQYMGSQSSKEADGLYAPAYHKYSLMPLSPSMVEGKNLESVLKNMTDNQIGYSVFKSGSKVGTVVNDEGKANSFYDKVVHGNINSENLQKQIVDYRFLKIQLDIAPKIKDEVIFGTQFRKLLFSNLFEGGTTKGMSNAKALFDEYTNIFERLIDTEMKKLVEELGVDPTKNYKSSDVKKLVTLLEEESKSRSLADNIVDALQTETLNGEILLKYNFDSMVNKAKIDSMLMSLVNSRVIKQMMNGDAMIQGAPTGFETKGKRAEGSSTKKFYRKDPKTGKTLPMEIGVPLTGEYRDTLLKKYGTLEAINKHIKDGTLTSREKKSLEWVGYRIPTQGLNSIEYMTISEFLPESSANLIVLPTEVVAKSGGDYDIDKLNVFRPYLDARGNQAKTDKNRIIEIAKEIVSHESNFNALITPNSTKILTDIVAELRYIEYSDKKKAKGEEPLSLEDYTERYKKDLSNTRFTNQLKLTTKVDQFAKFLGGKSGVGIGALQNTHHILSQIANLTLNREYIVDGEVKTLSIWFEHNKTPDGKVDLSKLKDQVGNHQISEIISQVINASVDIAKDPFMFDLNMNQDTLATYLYLVRTGVEFEQIAYFMKQPIITEFLAESSVNKSVFLKAADKSKSDVEIKDDLIEKYRKQLERIVFEEAQLGLAADGLRDEVKPDSRNSEEIFDSFMADNSEFRDNITTEELKGYLSKPNQSSKEFYLTQIQMIENYFEYKAQAGLLSDAINSMNHDTAGVGSNIEASENKEEQKKRVKESKFINNIDAIYKETFVGKFDKHQFTIDVYSQFYNTKVNKEVSKNNRFLLDTIAGKFMKEANKNKLSTLITNDFINYVIQNYGYDSDIRDKVYDLFKGDNSIARQILRLKTDKNPTPEVKAIQDNLLIKELYPMLADAEKDIDNIKIFSKRFDTFTANQLTESFRELKDLDPILATNLMDLGIIQSGLNNSAITYMGVVPFEYYGDLVKKAFKEFDKKNGALELQKFNQLFIRNNSKDSNVWRYAKFHKLNTQKVQHRYNQYTGNYNTIPARNNGLGYGMYLKDYDKDQFKAELHFPVKAKDKEKSLELSTQDDNYTNANLEGTDVFTNEDLAAGKLEGEKEGFTFKYEGKSISTQFDLTKSQEAALKALIDFSDSKTKAITLQGPAGTGKTSVIGYLQKYLEGSAKLIYMAPTHAATAELAFATVKTGNKVLPMTVASAFKISTDSEGVKHASMTKKFQDKLSYFNNIVVVDEVSMLASKDYNLILAALKNNENIKIIFMGDILQIPEVDVNNAETKQISKAFVDNEQVLLTEVKRTESSEILNVLSNLRKNTNSLIPEVPSSKHIKYVSDSDFNKLIVENFQKDGENSVLISYTNKGVEGSNKKIREVLGRTGDLQKNDVIVGYLGYSSKQIEKGNIANSIRFTVEDVSKNGSAYTIIATSDKMKNLKELGISQVPEKFSTTYLQLDNSDAFTFDDLTQEDFDKNNKELSVKMEKLHRAKLAALKNPKLWIEYYSVQGQIAQYLANVNLGNDYIYNPTTEKMERYNPALHKRIDSDLKIDKGVDFGHAITIHKSQGTTVKNVFFDTNTLPKGSSSRLYNGDNQVSTERHALIYVGMSRASDLLVVKKDDPSLFYSAEELVPNNTKDYNKDLDIEDINDTFVSSSPKDFVNHTGGALGGDITWDKIGREFGVENHTHYWMNTKTPHGNKEISKADEIEGQQKVTIAARQMGRIAETHQVRDERLIRNWSQVKYADAIFAVTTLLPKGSVMNYGKVALIEQGKGGTGYAVQMAINEGKTVYLYDQVRKQWYSNIEGKWSKTEIPTLTKNFAGIGTRELNSEGIQAIRDVYEQTFNKPKTLDSKKPAGTINVYWGQAESATSTKVLSNLAPREFTYKGKTYGSVEHAYQTLKSGEFDQVTYDAYQKIGGFGKKIRGSKGRNGAFDNLQLMRDLIVESFVQNPSSEAAKKLVQYENFTHNTNEIIDQAFLEGLKLAQKELLKNTKTLDSKKLRGPVRADSLSEFKKATGLTRSEVQSDDKYKIKGKIDKFNKEFGSNYDVKFKKVGESNLVTFTITGGPKAQTELELTGEAEMDYQEYYKLEFNDAKRFILDMFEGEEQEALLEELYAVDSDKKMGILKNKLCK